MEDFFHKLGKKRSGVFLHLTYHPSLSLGSIKVPRPLFFDLLPKEPVSPIVCVDGYWKLKIMEVVTDHAEQQAT